MPKKSVYSLSYGSLHAVNCGLKWANNMREKRGSFTYYQFQLPLDEEQNNRPGELS